jgi:hypothetical protein
VSDLFAKHEQKHSGRGKGKVVEAAPTPDMESTAPLPVAMNSLKQLFEQAQAGDRIKCVRSLLVPLASTPPCISLPPVPVGLNAFHAAKIPPSG